MVLIGSMLSEVPSLSPNIMGLLFQLLRTRMCLLLERMELHISVSSSAAATSGGVNRFGAFARSAINVSGKGAPSTYGGLATANTNAAGGFGAVGSGMSSTLSGTTHSSSLGTVFGTANNSNGAASFGSLAAATTNTTPPRTSMTYTNSSSF